MEGGAEKSRVVDMEGSQIGEDTGSTERAEPAVSH